MRLPKGKRANHPARAGLPADTAQAALAWFVNRHRPCPLPHDMDTLATTDWMTLMLLVFGLGLKHGLDADHLATIDGLARYNSGRGAGVARWCGVLFSLGHGAVVVAIALAVGMAGDLWAPPAWVEHLGVWISIGFLALLGSLNLRTALLTPAGQPVRPAALKGRLLGRLQHTSHPLLIATVGALFALSLDTLSQAALFASAGSRFGGVGHALLLGLLFTAGMLLADGLNGLWIARMLRRTDRVADLASRGLGLAIGWLSLLVAAWGLARVASPAAAAWGDGKELAFGLALLAAMALSVVVALHRAARAVRT